MTVEAKTRSPSQLSSHSVKGMEMEMRMMRNRVSSMQLRVI